MRPASYTRFAERVISRLAARQHGVVARFQLLAAGVSAEQIKRRLQAGRLTALHKGVYLVGAVAPTHANEMAALLCYGSRRRSLTGRRRRAGTYSRIPQPPRCGSRSGRSGPRRDQESKLSAHGSTLATFAIATGWR